MDKKVIIIISVVGVVLLLTILGAVAAVFFFMNQAPPAPVDPNRRPEEIVTVALTTTLMANVLDESGDVHVLRIHPAFELNAESDGIDILNATTFPLMEIRIRDAILTLASTYTYEMLLAPGAHSRVAIDIKDTINQLFDTDVIFGVIWQEFLVQ